MLRVWGKVYDRVRLVADAEAVSEETNRSFDERLDDCLTQIVHELDLAKPIWFPANRDELSRFRKTQFFADHFIESFPYHLFEVEILEMDGDEK